MIKLDDEENSKDANGDVNIKTPPPSRMLHKDTPEQRSTDARNTKRQICQSLVPSAFIDLVKHDRDHDHHDRQQSCSTDTLDGSENNQHDHGRSGSTANGSDEKDDTGAEIHGLEAKDVGEATIERLEGGVCQKVCGCNPCHLGLGIEIGGDLGQGGGDDRVVQCCQDAS